MLTLTARLSTVSSVSQVRRKLALSSELRTRCALILIVALL